MGLGLSIKRNNKWNIHTNNAFLFSLNTKNHFNYVYLVWKKQDSVVATVSEEYNTLYILEEGIQ